MFFDFGANKDLTSTLEDWTTERLRELLARAEAMPEFSWVADAIKQELAWRANVKAALKEVVQ